MARPRSDLAVGLTFGLAAYGFWAFAFPLHLRLLDASAPPDVVVSQPQWALEILCQRVVWSLVLCAALVAVRGRGEELRRLLGDRRTVALLAGTAVLVSVNWLVFIYAVSSDQLYRAGIGYFVTPMVQIALGTALLGERLRRFQWAAIACAGVGIGWLVAVASGLPWIELALAVSFGFYGLLRKRARAGPIVGLTVETAVLTAMLFSSAGFAIVHMSIFRFLPTFILGVLMASIVIRTRSIFPAMLLHAVYNGLAFLVLDRIGEDPGMMPWAVSVGLFAVGVALLRSPAART